MLDSVRSQYEVTERNGQIQNRVHLSEPRQPMPPQSVLDELADRALDGGWNTRKSNTCPDCYEVRSVNGSCGC